MSRTHLPHTDEAELAEIRNGGAGDPKAHAASRIIARSAGPPSCGSDMRLAQATDAKKTLKSHIASLEKQIDQDLDRIVDASTDSVVAAYEKRLAKLEREKLPAQEQLAETGPPRNTLAESFEHDVTFLAKPWKIWENADHAFKETVLRPAFSGPLP